MKTTNFSECSLQFNQYLQELQGFIFEMVGSHFLLNIIRTFRITFQVLQTDVDDVAAVILLGVEDALSHKKKQYVSSDISDPQKFALEVNFVTR